MISAVLLTPSLVLLVSLAGRRWGPVVSGRLSALPLTSGPLVLMAALTGPAGVGSSMADGALAGMPMVVAFCAGYRLLATRQSWQVSIVVVGTVTVLTAALLSLVALPIWATATLICTAAGIASARQAPPRDIRPTIPVPELLLRMVLTATLVLLLSVVSRAIDPHFAGVLATFPALMCVLAPMVHRRDGATAATEMVNGLLAGLLPTLLFFVLIRGL